MKVNSIGTSQKNFSSIIGGAQPSTSAYIFTLKQGTNLAVCRFWTWNHHHNLPVNGGILIYVPHLVLRRPSWGPLPGGQRDGGHGGAQHDHGECHQYCLSHLYQNASAHGRWIHRNEDNYQVDSEMGDMGELNMIMENVINIDCRTFIKKPVHMEDEFMEMRTITRWTASRGTWGSSSCSWRMSSILLVAPLLKCQHTWNPSHSSLLIVHLVMVLISVNSSSICAGILIKVQQAILMTFSMILLSSPMSPISLSTW